MSHQNIPRFALISVNEKGEYNTRLFHTPDLMAAEEAKLPITSAYYCAKVMEARVFEKISLSNAGRKAGTTVAKKKS